jgi:hypothetical protein
VFARCHTECEKDWDCPRAERCVRAVNEEGKEVEANLNVCQLSVEATCEADSDCKGVQICGVGSECRDPCTQPADCTPTQICAISGECASSFPLKDTVVDGRIVSSGIDGAGSNGEGGAGGAQGGAPNTAGGTAGLGALGGRSDAGMGSQMGGSASAEGGRPATGGARATSYVETPDGANDVPNDRESAWEMPTSVDLWLTRSDEDWFFVDAPDDGKAHIIRIDVVQDAGTGAEVAAYSGQDNSPLGTSLGLEPGTKRSVYLSVGSGTRTLIDFLGGVLNYGAMSFSWSMSTELDEYEPNNDRDSAASIPLNTNVTAQQVVAHIDIDHHSPDDWYAVELEAGPATVNVLSVPDDVGLTVYRMDSSEQNLRLGILPVGVHQPIATTIPSRGRYRFQFTSGVPAIAQGTPPHLSEPYVFRIEQGAGAGSGGAGSN